VANFPEPHRCWTCVCWWQVNGRADKPMPLHTEDDMFYVQNYSLWLDVRILFMTLGAVVSRKGAC
jgi:lipopolysaccharide/colanic/teichoic acid biosynthesis glycosyltransferase